MSGKPLLHGVIPAQARIQPIDPCSLRAPSRVRGDDGKKSGQYICFVFSDSAS